MFCSVPATCTSTLGIVYDPSSFTCDCKGSSTWQYCSGSLAPPLPGVIRMPVFSAFGTVAATSQLSVDCRPPEYPPCSSTDFRRALSAMSNPFQCWYWSPKLLAAVTKLSFWTVNNDGMTFCTVTTAGRPAGSRGSFGIGTFAIVYADGGSARFCVIRKLPNQRRK